MKKITWIIIICTIILAGIICAVVYDQAKKAIPSANIDTNNINNAQEDNLMNKIDDNMSQYEIGQNEITENEIASNTQQEENQTTENEPKNEEEKAIQIVKKDYKQTENVEFSSEGTDAEGNRIVVIRDPETTEALAFYFVNTSNNTFTKKEMN